MTDTRRSRCSRVVAWKRSLSSRSSSSRPTNGASRPSLAIAAADLGHDPQGPPGGDRRRLALEHLLAGRLEGDRPRPAARWVASPTSTVPGGATDWSRAAVLTRSPATMPWFVAPSVTAASPVRTPARAWIAGPRLRTASTSSSAARTARSASSSWATGAPQTAITASPMNFSTVPP